MLLKGFKYCFVTLTVQFNTIISLSVKWLNSYLRSIHWTLTGITNPAHSGTGSNGKEVYYTFLEAPGLDPHHQVLFNVTVYTKSRKNELA